MSAEVVQSQTSVIIAGDSYSVSTAPWHSSWLCDYRACSGFSNRDIYYSIKSLSGPAIINLSSLHRLPLALQSAPLSDNSRMVSHQPGNSDLYRLNCEYAKRIITQWKTSAIIWSPFPDYESWKDVEWINLGPEDNMWASLYNRETKYYNHLTLEGHAQLNSWMHKALERKLEWTFQL